MTMKNLILSFALICTMSISFAQNQLSVPTCPNKVEFANIMINLNDDVQKKINTEINNLLTPPNKFLDQKIERMQLYFPIIERVLEEENVPEDVKYLSVMESALLPEAISSSNAIGYWQFKEPTAKEVGLRIDNNQDERKNIYFSTKAAATYLKKNNLTLKNWISAILSFNKGLGGAKSEVPESWTNASEIDFTNAVDEYLIKALAYRIAFEHRLNRTKESEKKFVEFPGNGKSLAEISVELGTDLNELRRYNSWLQGSSIQNDKKYNVLILTGGTNSEDIENKVKKRSDLITGNINFPELKRITEATTSADAPIFYQINGKKGIMSTSGQEAAQMAQKSKVKLKSFLSYNDMTDKDITKEGQIYYLQKKSKTAKVPYHTLNSNQSLWDVSQMYGLRLASLFKFNRMKKTERGQAGRVLWMQKTRPKKTPIEYIKDILPNKPTEPILASTETNKEVLESSKKPSKLDAKPIDSEPMSSTDPIFDSKPKAKEVITYPKSKTPIANNNTHIVKNGETIYSIAKMYGITSNELKALNNIEPGEIIQENQRLIVSRETNTSSKNPEPEVIKATEKPKPEVVKAAEKPKPEVVKVIEKPESAIEEEVVLSPVNNKPATPVLIENTSNGFHVVSKGETAYSISRKYDLTVSQLLAMNNMKSATVEIGQALKVSKQAKITPAKASNPEPITEPITEVKASKPAPIKVISSHTSTGLKYHTVKTGETLFSISKKYGVSTDQVKQWNKLPDNNVKLGASLIVSK